MEYRALAQIAADVSWVQQLLLDVHVSVALPHIIWCDNMSTIALASNPIIYARTKHVKVDYHYIREKVLLKQIIGHHCLTSLYAYNQTCFDLRTLLHPNSLRS